MRSRSRFHSLPTCGSVIHVLPFTAQLVRGRAFFVSCVLLTIVGIVCVSLSLVGTLGYESALVLSLPAAFTGFRLGTDSYRWLHREYRSSPLPDPPVNAYEQWLAASFVGLVALAIPFFMLVVSALWRPQCDWEGALWWWALIPVPSVFFGAGFGIALGVPPGRQRRWGLFAFAGLILASLLRFGLRLADGPVLFAYNHFFGYFPGPLYDEVLRVPLGLLYLRVLTILLALVLVGFVHARRARRPGAWFAWGLIVASALLVHAGRHLVDIDQGRRQVQEALGGVRETEHFTIYWDEKGGINTRDMDDMVLDHEYRYAQLAEFLQIEPSQKVTSYVFASTARKKELVGAADTQVANPYRREIYIDTAKINHGVLKHELVHAFSGEFGWPVLGYSNKMGLIEGIAVAADWTSSGRRDPHREAAAMQLDGELPDPADIMGIATFYAARPAVAYSTMGSFVRFLVDTYGIEKFREVYPWAKFERVYGKNLDTLTAEWREFLSQIEVTEGERKAYAQRFAAPSIFEQDCARKVAEVEKRAWQYMGRGAYSQAEASFKELAELDDSSRAWRGLTYTYMRWEKLDRALTAWEAWSSRENPDSAGELRARIVRGDLYWLEQDYESARETYRAVLGWHLSPRTDRELAIKIAALEPGDALDDDVRQPLRVLLIGNGSHDGARLRLIEAAREGAAGAAADYVLGRHYLQDREPELGWRFLRAADQPTVTESAWLAELYIQESRALFRLERYDDATRILKKVGEIPNVSPQQAARAADWIERCQWIEKTGGIRES